MKKDPSRPTVDRVSRSKGLGEQALVGVICLSLLLLSSIQVAFGQEEAQPAQPTESLEARSVSQGALEFSTLFVQPVYFAGQFVFALGGGIVGLAKWPVDEEKAKETWRVSLEAPWLWHEFVKSRLVLLPNSPQNDHSHHHGHGSYDE